MHVAAYYFGLLKAHGLTVSHEAPAMHIAPEMQKGLR